MVPLLSSLSRAKPTWGYELNLLAPKEASFGRKPDKASGGCGTRELWFLLCNGTLLCCVVGDVRWTEDIKVWRDGNLSGGRQV